MFLRALVAEYRDRSGVWWSGRVKVLGLTALLALVVLAVAAQAASAEPVCTDTWTGASGGEWQTATNWSTSKVPTSSDVACIGLETTVNVTEGINQTGVLEDKGTLAISGGSLELANALEASSTSTLNLSGGTLTGAGTLDISGSLQWDTHIGFSGTMAGSGQTVLKPGASGIIYYNNDPSEAVYLTERTFVNEGTMTLQTSALFMSEGAQFKNVGTF